MVSIAIDSRTGEKNWCPTVSNVDEVNPDRVTKVFDESEAHQAKLDERKHQCNLSDMGELSHQMHIARGERREAQREVEHSFNKALAEAVDTVERGLDVEDREQSGMCSLQRTNHDQYLDVCSACYQSPRIG